MRYLSAVALLAIVLILLGFGIAYQEHIKQAFGIAKAVYDVSLADQGYKLDGHDTEANISRLLDNKEDAKTQFHIGRRYAKGEGVPQDYAEAAKWYRKAAEQGVTLAQHNLSAMYAKGQGVEQDHAEAEKWYRKATGQVDAEAQVSQQYSEEAARQRKSAEQGNLGAQYNLGLKYEKGRGVPQDYAEAVKWYGKAAERGYAGAQTKLAFMYSEGLGVPQNHAEAFRWYGKSAEQGGNMAQYNLGKKYRDGLGVPQDNVVAYMWFNIAATNGYKGSIELKDKLAASMTPAMIEKAQQLAQECIAKSYKNCP